MAALGQEVSPLAIEVRQLGPVTLLVLRGNLLFGPATDSLRQRVEELLDAGCASLVIDLRHLSRLDSVGVGTLIDAANRARSAGAAFHLLEPSAPARAVLALLGLHRHPDLLPIVNDPEKALNRLVSALLPA